MRTQFWIDRTHVKQVVVVCVSNPRVPGIKWESEKEQFLETHKSASPVFGAASKRHYFKGGESQH